MPYVNRNKEGEIIGIFSTAQYEGHEYVDGEVELYHPPVSAETLLAQSDASIIRVVDDIVAALVAKEVVKLSDFPASVVEKLTERKKLREKL